MMTPHLDTDPAALAVDGSVILGLNGMTSTVKDWLEGILPEPVLPLVRRGYVALPLVLAGLMCLVLDGFRWGPHTMACSMKYGMGAAYAKILHSKAVKGG